MRCSLLFLPFAIVFANWFPSATAQEGSSEAPRVEKRVTIRALAARMLYDTREFSVPAGARLVLQLVNDDELPHNWVLCAPTEDRGMELARAAWDLGAAGFERDWVPEDPRVIAASRMLQPHQVQTLEVDVPTEPGTYPYVCTFPGHAMLMNGIMRVTEPGHGQGIGDLSFRFYLGMFDRVPDFDALTPHREGSLEDGLLGFRLDDYREQFAVEFRGFLDVPQDGDYRFFLASDDGAKFWLGGRMLIDNDGVHGSGPIRERRVRLEKGRKDFRLGYFEGAGDEHLFLAWSGPGFEEAALSEWIHPARRRNDSNREEQQPGMPLVPVDTPIIYREFIQGASPRGIGVGYPGGISVVWDAGPMNLALVWRGAFIDARQHWTDRGAGFASPLGYDVFTPAAGQPVADLAEEGAPWPALEMPPSGYRFRGYRLDGERRPTFSFDWGELRFEDRLDPVGTYASPNAGLVRTLRWEGKASEGVFFRAAAGSGLTEIEAGSYGVDGRFTVRVEPGTEVVLRETQGAQELLIPVKNATGVARVTYGWPH